MKFPFYGFLLIFMIFDKNQFKSRITVGVLERVHGQTKKVFFPKNVKNKGKST